MKKFQIIFDICEKSALSKSAIKNMLFTLFFPRFENYRNQGHFEKDHPKNGQTRGNL